MLSVNLIQTIKSDWHLQSQVMRRAIRTAIAIIIAIIVYRYFHLMQGFWVPMTVLVVMQATVGATLRRGLQRFLGTVIGIAIGSALLTIIQHPLIIEVLLLLAVFITYYFNLYSNLINYGFIVVPLSIMVVLLMEMVAPQNGSMHLLIARIYDTCIGALIAVLCSLVILPSKVKTALIESEQQTFQQLAEYFSAIIALILKKPDAQQQCLTQKRLVEDYLLINRQLFLERAYEIPFGFKRRQQCKIILIHMEKLAQLLFLLHNDARQPLPDQLIDLWQNPLQQLENIIRQFLDYINQHLSYDETCVAPIDTQKIINQLSHETTHFFKEKTTSDQLLQQLAPAAGLLYLLSDVENTLQQVAKVFNEIKFSTPLKTNKTLQISQVQQ